MSEVRRSRRGSCSRVGSPAAGAACHARHDGPCRRRRAGGLLSRRRRPSGARPEPAPAVRGRTGGADPKLVARRSAPSADFTFAAAGPEKEGRVARLLPPRSYRARPGRARIKLNGSTPAPTITSSSASAAIPRPASPARSRSASAAAAGPPRHDGERELRGCRRQRPLALRPGAAQPDDRDRSWTGPRRVRPYLRCPAQRGRFRARSTSTTSP